MSSASSRDNKRVQAAMYRSQSEQPKGSEQAKVEPKDAAAAKPAAENTSLTTERSALALKRHRSHSMDNRPVDPSPIDISHTVRMAGQRPIGSSDNKGRIDFSKSATILNRPIAPNSTPDDKAMVEYLD